VTILAIAGGLMGVLMMIPLRRALIVKEHGNLPYPEGTACAEVLIAGEKGGIHAKTVFQAFGIAFVYKFLMTALRTWRENPGAVLRGYQNAEVRMEVSPELLGVGYIIGPRIAGYLFAGGCLAYVVLMPAIKLFGSAMTEPMFGTTTLIRDMNAGEIRAAFVFYIGAGAVASAGIIALARSLPTIVGAFRAGFADMRASRLGQAIAAKLRTDDDLPISVTIFGSIGLAIALAFLPQIGVNLLGAVLIVVFGFFFTTVSSRICGQVGPDCDLLHLPAAGLGPDRRPRAGDLDRVRHRGRRRERREYLSGPEDRLPGWRDAAAPADRDPHRRDRVRPRRRLDAHVLEQGVHLSRPRNARGIRRTSQRHQPRQQRSRACRDDVALRRRRHRLDR
jgi:putative OPT family oligopeptide transporter